MKSGMRRVNGRSAPCPLNSLWVGNELGYLEQLCLRSAIATGHEFNLFSYAPQELSGVPKGVELRDAADVMPIDRLLFYADSGSVALGANLWRYHLLRKGLGYWVDMDLIFLSRFDFEEPYVFGWQDSQTINNAVLKAPAESQFVEDLLRLPQPNHCPPWFGPKRRALYHLRRAARGRIGLEDMPWGTYGPELVTYLARKHRLQAFAHAPTVLYPLPWRDASLLYQPAELVEGLITEDTKAVHMWCGRLGDAKNSPPAPGSFLAKMCERFSVELSPAPHLPQSLDLRAGSRCS